MKLSIIIPTFNSAKTLKRALDSIVSQSYSDWEVLIMDGVSKDETINIAKSYNDDRIRIYSEPDKGIYDAMNKGIKKSRGEWLYFLGSDDWLYDDNVLKFVFQDNDFSEYDVVYGEVESDVFHDKFGEWSVATLECNRCHQGIFYRRNFFEKGNMYNIKYNVWADHDINLRWFLNFRSKYIPLIVAHYCADGYSANKVDVFFDNVICLKIILYGRSSLDVKEKKFYARRYVEKNSGNHLMRMIMKIYIGCLRIIDKLNRLCYT